MTKKPKNKFRANIKGYVDADYLDKLSESEKQWYSDFTNEYYCNAINRKDSLHRKNLSKEEFERCKKETFASTNAQNRDSFGIAATSQYFLVYTDAHKYRDIADSIFGVIDPDDRKLKDLANPFLAFNTLLSETIDELNSECSRALDQILVEFAREMVLLGHSLKKDKINKLLKKRKDQ